MNDQILLQKGETYDFDFKSGEPMDCRPSQLSGSTSESSPDTRPPEVGFFGESMNVNEEDQH
eukprot:CAMPEP_0177660000 /NCGR_PEP_ID=MMETSP0447-20121125/17764_1 /TAXON_ID=0 /ORGANISM="Stygamoeba regulata, Strain BSH-02190019" /LENGTH=61 /DNA_ID=CAMNT_0019164951 /DNA_START=638 /DNA_END=823 /DNA_ORIENTATION=-